MSTAALVEFLSSTLFAPPQAHRRGAMLPAAVGQPCPLYRARMSAGAMVSMFVVPPVYYAARVADDPGGVLGAIAGEVERFVRGNRGSPAR